MSILFFSKNPRPMPIADGIVAHCIPLSTPQMLETEALWSATGFPAMLDAAKFCVPLSVVKMEGLKDECGRDVAYEATAEWVERLSPEAVSLLLTAVLRACSPSDAEGNGSR